MTLPQFNKQLGILTLVLIGVSVSLSYFQPFEDTLGLSISTILFFAILTIVLFFLGNATSNSSNKNHFLVVAMSSIFVKLVLTLLILFTYQAFFAPVSRSHLFLFIIIYLAYTIFETYLLMKLSKPKS